MNKQLLVEKHISTRRPPVNLERSDSWLFQREYQRVIERSELFCFEDVQITGQDLFGHPRLPKLIYPYGASRKDLLIRSASRLLLKTRSIPEGLWISDNWSYGYFHWLNDCLPRLIMAKQKIKDDVPLLLPERLGRFSFVIDSLELLGIHYMLMPTLSKVQVKRLWLPAQLAHSGNYYAESLHILRSHLPLRREKGSRRIYISRQRSQRRRILNSLEVEVLLTEFGFEMIHMEDLTFREQLELTNQSDIVCGVHGAGLANILFAPAGTKVMEIRRAGDDWNNCYFSLASELNLPYFYLTGQGNSDSTLRSDLMVNTDKLRRVLELMCLEQQHLPWQRRI